MTFTQNESEYIAMNTQNLKPFKPGQSGNPAGRPKGARGRATIIRRWLEAIDKAKNPITGDTEQMSVEDRMTLAILAKALKGDTNAYKALMDSAYGAPKQEIEETSTQEVITRIKWSDE